ncbi:hypothetical protein ACP70R_029953 [Stipagrostis hirtigluma subsp. patula]
MVGHGGGGGGGSEAAAMSPAASGGKRGRGHEEDVYVDNLHSHKRYLSEIMASSMNGLSVGDNTIVSPLRPDNASCLRDDMIMQYSPMSEESDDDRYYDTHINNNGNQTDAMSSPSTSPVSSPHRLQKAHGWFSSVNPCPLPSCSLSAVVCSHTSRGTEHEGRIPSSPNDMCHGGDLRRAALLRSVQMRVQSPQGTNLLFGNGHELEQDRRHAHTEEPEHGHRQLGGVELEQRSCPKSVQEPRC